MSKHTQSFLATFLLFPCKKDDKKLSSERFLMETLTTESAENTQRAQRKGREENTEMLFEHGNNMVIFGVIK
jgi:hypothetical protein